MWVSKIGSLATNYKDLQEKEHEQHVDHCCSYLLVTCCRSQAVPCKVLCGGLQRCALSRSGLLPPRKYKKSKIRWFCLLPLVCNNTLFSSFPAWKTHEKNQDVGLFDSFLPRKCNKKNTLVSKQQYIFQILSFLSFYLVSHELFFRERGLL